MRSRRPGPAVALLLGLFVALTGCGAGPAGPGTWAEPLPVGATAGIGSWDLAVGSTIADADAIIAADDPANTPPPEGRRYVLVPLRLSYHGSDLGEPWIELDVRFVTESGAMYGESDADQCGSVPGSIEYIDETPPGATRWGNVCVAVPADQIEGGSWIARNGGFWGWQGFFAASDDDPTGPGSRAEPTPAGSPVEVGGYAVSVGPTDVDALARLRSWDENAASPASGRRYVLAPVTATFHGGSSSGDPWQDLGVRWVSADGTAYGAAEEDSCGGIPEPLDEVGVLAAEASVTANVCVSVPADAVQDGRWHIVPEGSAFVWAGYFAS